MKNVTSNLLFICPLKPVARDQLYLAHRTDRENGPERRMIHCGIDQAELRRIEEIGCLQPDVEIPVADREAFVQRHVQLVRPRTADAVTARRAVGSGSRKGKRGG